MERRRFGDRGPELPVVGLGTWQVFEGHAAIADRVVDAAWTAARGSSTRPRCTARRRVASATRSATGVPTRSWRRRSGRIRGDARRQLDAQLGYFGGRVELEQVHNLLRWEEHLPWLGEEREAGRIGLLGITHYAVSAFDEARPRSAQAGSTPSRSPQAGRARGRARLLRCRGARGRRDRHAPARRERASLLPGPDPAELNGLGVESWAEALLRWSLADERVHVVIPATSSTDHARERTGWRRAAVRARRAPPGGGAGASLIVSRAG